MAKKGKWSGQAKRFVKRYNSYRRNFNKRVNKMIDSGLTPYDAIPLNYREYKAIYTEERNDRVKEVEKGERSSVGDINAKIISDQVYELSEEQAYAIFKYMKTLSPEEKAELNFSYRNINAAIAKIREGQFVKEELGLWDIIKDERERLFAEGLSKKEVGKKIAQTFFGSP